MEVALLSLGHTEGEGSVGHEGVANIVFAHSAPGLLVRNKQFNGTYCYSCIFNLVRLKFVITTTGFEGVLLNNMCTERDTLGMR